MSILDDNRYIEPLREMLTGKCILARSEPGEIMFYFNSENVEAAKAFQKFLDSQYTSRPIPDARYPERVVRGATPYYLTNALTKFWGKAGKRKEKDEFEIAVAQLAVNREIPWLDNPSEYQINEALRRGIPSMDNLIKPAFGEKACVLGGFANEAARHQARDLIAGLPRQAAQRQIRPIPSLIAAYSDVQIKMENVGEDSLRVIFSGKSHNLELVKHDVENHLKQSKIKSRWEDKPRPLGH